MLAFRRRATRKERGTVAKNARGQGKRTFHGCERIVCVSGSVRVGGSSRSPGVVRHFRSGDRSLPRGGAAVAGDDGGGHRGYGVFKSTGAVRATSQPYVCFA